MATAAEARTLQNYIGGQWQEAQTSNALDDRDPATGELTARVPLSGTADVDAAVVAARAAQPAWRQVPPQERARAVLALRDALIEHRQELTALVTADMGKTLADADGEVGRGIESVESAAAIPHLLKGETLEGVASGIDVELVRQPVGVVAAITPFNFPAMIPLWFLPYAVACGNAFVLKPSERDPRPASADLRADRRGQEIFPPGVVNLVHGGREAVESILDHPGVDAVSFVGQAKTARLDRHPLGGDRQAGAGARRRQELDDRRRRRRPRQHRPRDHGLGLRGGRAALPRRLGLRDRRRREPPGRGAGAPAKRRRGTHDRAGSRPRHRRLPGGPEGRAHDRGDGAGEVGVVGDDHRVLGATQRLHPLAGGRRRAGGDQAGCLGLADEYDVSTPGWSRINSTTSRPPCTRLTAEFAASISSQIR